MIPGNCDICLKESKYTCPACSAKSCSAVCVKAHKTKTGCTGQIDPAAFLTKGDLLTTVALDRDYNFLQRIGRDIHLDKSDARGSRVMKPRDQWRAGARVHSMGPGMSRRRKNRSHWNNAESQFEWTVQVIESAQTSQYVQLGDKTLVAALPQMFHQPEEKRVVLRDAFGKQIELDKTKSFQDAIRGKDVLEFPTIEFTDPVSDEDSSDSSSEDSDSSDDSSDESEESDENEEIEVEEKIEERIEGSVESKPVENEIEESKSVETKPEEIKNVENEIEQNTSTNSSNNSNPSSDFHGVPTHNRHSIPDPESDNEPPEETSAKEMPNMVSENVETTSNMVSENVPENIVSENGPPKVPLKVSESVSPKVPENVCGNMSNR